MSNLVSKHPPMHYPWARTGFCWGIGMFGGMCLSALITASMFTTTPGAPSPPPIRHYDILWATTIISLLLAIWVMRPGKPPRELYLHYTEVSDVVAASIDWTNAQRNYNNVVRLATRDQMNAATDALQLAEARLTKAVTNLPEELT